MHALVVYESMYGNTQEIAEAIGQGLAGTARVDVVEVGSAPATIADDIDLLVVGGPTHAFSMSRATTRRDARSEQATVSSGDGIREWLRSLGPVAVAAATFDTKMHKPRLPGSAARGAARHLKHAGCRLVTRPETFYVADKNGPLVDGEIQRSAAWGNRLASLVGGRTSSR